MIGLLVALCFPKPSCEISVYSDYFDGRRTASGTRFSQRGMTCAVSRHKVARFPFGSKVTLYYKNRSVTVTVTDTGGYTPKRSADWFDLSKSAMQKLLGKNYNTRIIGTYESISARRKQPRYKH